MTISRIDVSLTDRSYPIFIGSHIWETCVSCLPDKARICIVSDDQVSSLYLDKIQDQLKMKHVFLFEPFVLSAGEQSKSWEVLQQLVQHILNQKVDRKTHILALGGGVVGDIAGFAASIVMRGLPFIQVPTTLLAQVDSSVGGKTGINTSAGKNLVGSFYQPHMVWIDTDILETLSSREFKAGYAEILKYSFINNASFFDFLNDNIDRIMLRDPVVLEAIIKASCESKAAIVAQDEREETGQRALLNLGHTFGHALEAIGGYDGRLLHGEAVAIGMLMAAGFSEKMGYAPEGMTSTIKRHMAKAGLMTRPPFAVTARQMATLMQQDKKAYSGKIQLVLMRGIGDSFLMHDVEEAVLVDFLNTWLNESIKNGE